MNYFQKLTIALSLAIATGCGKTKVQPPPDSITDLQKILPGTDWQMTAFTITPALNGVTDVILNTPPCAKDNILQFRSGGVFFLDEGATKCNITDIQSDMGIWNFDASIQQLSYSSPKLGSFIINVNAVSASSISGTRTVVMNGQSYTFSGTLTRQ